MRTVRVKLGKNSYTVHIGKGLLSEAGTQLRELGFSGKAVVITNPAVKKLYGAVVQKSLKSAV